jgi:glyoxylase-like metal-dependent hydrolase (beta-lactamase superfamily II)
MNLMWRVGDVTVTRVEESVIPLRPELLLPDLANELIERERPWVDPYFDDQGRIRLSIHSFVVVSDGITIVIDTCVGGAPERPLPGDPAFLDRLDEAVPGGLNAVDVVLCTHLHFDHVGWNTVVTDGVRVPTFANARYLFGRVDWKTLADHDREGVADTCIQPIIDAGAARFVDTDHRLTGEVRLVATPGHTPGHVSVLLESSGESALITGDTAHSPIQFAHPELAATPFDADSEQAADTRRRLVDRYADTDTLVLGTHFPPPTAGRLVRRGAAAATFSTLR